MKSAQLTERHHRGEIALFSTPLLWLALFFLIPALVVVAYSFKPPTLWGGFEEGWTFDTWIALFKRPFTYTLIFRTLFISLFATILTTLLALPVGYYIAKAPPKRKQALLLLTILPFWSSFLIRVFAWKAILHPDGFLKELLVFLRIIGQDQILLYNQGAVVLAMIYCHLPFAILPIYSASERFDDHLVEAAQDLGLSSLQAFIKIFIPCIKAGLTTAFMLVFIPCAGAYVIPDVLGGFGSEMIGNKIMQRTFIDRNLPLASALSIVLALLSLVPIVILSLIQRRQKTFLRNRP